MSPGASVFTVATGIAATNTVAHNGFDHMDQGEISHGTQAKVVCRQSLQCLHRVECL